VSALDRNRRQRCNVLDGEKQLSALYSTVGYRVVSENTVWFPTSPYTSMIFNIFER